MKANIYFQLNPMPEEEAIKFAALHLEGVVHEWWHHDTITLGHDQINTYAEFMERLIERFDGKDLELNFKDLAQLRQIGLVDQFVVKFQKHSILVMNISKRRRVVLFMDGLTKPLKGWVKWFNAATLSEAINKAQSMASSSTSSSRSYSHSKLSVFLRDKPLARKPSLDEATRQELRRKKLCFNCKGPWEPNHRCLGKGKIHYIEVVSDDEDEQEEMPTEDNQPHDDTNMVSLNRTERIAALVRRGGTISLAGSLRCTVFRVQETLQEQRVMVMFDSEATLNFISSSLLKRRGLPTETHAGFQVKVARGTLLPCMPLGPQLSITTANHTVTEDLFIVDLDNMEVILGVQWMETLDEYTQSFKQMDFTFVVDGKKVVLHGMANEGPKEVSAHRMEVIFRCDDVAWAAHCFVLAKLIKGQRTPPQDDELQDILSKHDKVFINIPPSIPSHRGFEHTIELEAGAKLVITTLYRHPKKFKDEIKKTIQELEEKGWICPSSSPFGSFVVLVKKKDHRLWTTVR